MSLRTVKQPFVTARRSLTDRFQGIRLTAMAPAIFEPLESRVFLSGAGLGSAGTIRIVSYNMEADINGATTPLPGFYQVLEGIGEETVQGNVRPLDILSLEETTSNSVTVAPIVTNLNSYYGGAAVYAQSPYQATQSGGAQDGNGPNALVYNTLTLNLLASVGVGTPEGSTNGEYRQVVRYEFQPVNDSGSTGIFYVYTSHMKSGTTSADATARGQEATIIRNNEAALPPTASVIYTGDLNSAPPEAEFTNFTAVGQGEAFDPVNFSSSVQYWSESDTDLRYRDDYQLMTQNVLNDTGALNYVNGSFHNFGNNGTTPSKGSVNSGSNTSLNTDLVQDGGAFISASTLYADLTTGSDHLPAVADYTVTLSTGVPTIGSFSASPTTVGAGSSTTLTAANVTEIGGAGSISAVNFYRENNGVSGLQTGSDTLVGAGTQSGTTWSTNASTAGLPAGAYIYYAVATDSNGISGSASSASLTVATAPAFVSSQVGDGSRQRSTISSVTVTFSEPVNFTAASFTLRQSQDDATWTDVSSAVTAANPSGDGMTWVITCNPGGALDRTTTGDKGFFSDGIYQLTLHGAKITDSATGAAALNGGADMLTPFSFNGGASMKNAFAVLYGDMFGSAVVNNADGLQFKNTFGSTDQGVGVYNAALDWFGTGAINNGDSLKLTGNFSKVYVFN